MLCPDGKLLCWRSGPITLNVAESSTAAGLETPAQCFADTEIRAPAGTDASRAAHTCGLERKNQANKAKTTAASPNRVMADQISEGNEAKAPFHHRKSTCCSGQSAVLATPPSNQSTSSPINANTMNAGAAQITKREAAPPN
jgi:hypothetical protein